MVVGEPNINNIMGGIENTGSVRLHNHRKKLKQRFDIIKKLGQGTYGKVQLGINKETGQEVAIKTIKKSKIETEADLVRIRREIQIMSSVQHPNIIHIYEVFENREKMVLVMEYAAGGELYDYLSERKVLAEEEARRIFRQIATACYYCHKHKICHRDLKLENILLDEHGNAKIADFGLSNVFDDQRLLSTFCGSPLYASPEIVKGTPYQGPEVDCWSLGVLLYTLVYGAMPFDGSNFKRLVKQISQGDYFEPKKPSRASPLIHDMLTVNPKNRANVEKICMHWWVNETYDECCLDISEELANQTPVRLDLLLSLAPPAPQLESDKLVVTGEIAGDTAGINAENTAPTRSQSAGSLMDMTNSAERRIKDLLTEELKATPKRKLETTVSTDQANLSKEGVKRKEKIVKENTIADITLHSPIQENVLLEDSSMSEDSPVKTRSMDVEPAETLLNQGAVCSEIIEEAKNNENKKVEKATTEKSVEKTKDIPQLETVKANSLDKENVGEVKKEEEKQKPESKIPAKRKIVKKKVLTDKNENSEAKTQPIEKPKAKQQTESEQKTETEEAQPPAKPVERRRSRIFETTEKFQNLISSTEPKAPIEKPKKIVIPGVNVGGFKKEFERKASLTGSTKITSPKKQSSLEQDDSAKDEPAVEEQKAVEPTPVESTSPESQESTPAESQIDQNKRAKIQNAVSVISNALDGTRKSKSRPCMTRKPPVPFGSSGRSASGSIQTLPLLHSPPPIPPSIPQKADLKESQGSTPAQVVEQNDENTPEENKTSMAEITLKSATLPRRKTTKAEIKLDYPAPKPATMGFKTEMAHHVEAPPKVSQQRSEVTVPSSSNFSIRSISLEPESKLKQIPRERIIPISFEKDVEVKKDNVISPPYKPPITKTFQTQRSTISQRSNSLSRQSTQESDSETTPSTGEPIRKSPREYIIPIAVEGGGYVTPRAGSLEPSDTASTTSTMTSKSKFGRRRLNDRDGSEDESPFGLLHRHSSFGRDSDSEDPRRDMFRMHSLRSSRPRKAAIEHNDSFSSGEDDDDDGFEILTAENLFSTLLSRVRDLTSRLNVDGRPGFPTSRLLASHFDRDHSNFWNMHERRDPLSRYAPISRNTSRDTSVDSGLSRGAGGVPWRRSVSRDLASDIDRVFKNPVETPTHTATLPRGDTNSNNENLNLTDLNLKKLKLSDEDALALSYLTPGLSRRIQKQLFAQLAPSEAKKLSRTLSMRNPTENKPLTSLEENKPKYKPLSQSSSTLPRRFSVENNPARYQNFKNNNEGEMLQNSSERGKSVLSDKDDPTSIPKFNRSFVPFKPYNRDLRSSTERTNIQNGCDYRQSYSNQNSDTYKMPSPDTTTSESLSSKNDDFSYKNSTSNYSDTSRLVKYLTPNVSTSEDYINNKTDTVRRRSPSVKRASRFLRPDFYDAPKEESYYLKEKKEREIETQKVLKEIRDKRKGRFRDGSISRESSRTDVEEKTNEDIMKQSNTDLTHNLLKKVSDNIKNIESNVKEFHNYVNVDANGEPKVIHDYVNVPADVNANSQVIKKERVSRIARPKSYPNEAHIVAANVECDKMKLKSTKLKKPESNSKDNEVEHEKPSNKNKFLQTIEKKFEKLRSFSNSPSSVCSDEKKSLVEDTIKRLREQSVPRNIENCSTESGLLKRAVSVEEITTADPKQLQPSRKSVTKILSLFKKYEDKTKKGEKSAKPKKSKDESSKKVKDDTKKISKSKNSQLNVKKTDALENELSGAPTVIESNNLENNSDISVENLLKNTQNNVQIVEPIVKIEQGKKMERPRSLLLDPTKRCQPAYNGAKSETNINDNDVKQRVSKLPVNSFRRSLNLDNAKFESSNLYKISNGTISQLQDRVKEDTHNKVPYQNRFRMNPNSPEPNTSTDNALYGSNRNSYILTDDGSVLLSPCEDDMSYDSWSVCSDYQNQDLTSPLSPSNNFYSADENESVSDRIRRKSFYTRFNEKKRPRKNTLNNYRDLDLYKDMNRKPNYNTLDYRLNEPSKKYYVRSSSATLSDSISNISNQSDRYQMYGPRMNRRSTSVCLYNLDEPNVVDDNSTAEKNSNYSYYNETSRFNDGPKSPPNGHRIANVMSSSLNHNILPSTSQQQL